jgi:hypothetical protein
VLKVFMWKCPPLICHDLLDAVHTSKMTTFEVEFVFWEKEVTRTEIWWVWGFRTTGIPFWSKRRSQRWQCDVMLHPRVRMPNSWVKMSWMVWWIKFNSLPIIVTVKCRSDLTRAGHIFFCFWSARSSRTRFTFHKPILIFRKFMLRFHSVWRKIWPCNPTQDFVSAFL